jgi:hypothetical protein
MSFARPSFRASETTALNHTMTMIKGKPKTEPDTNGAPQFRENPEINAKIDDYIKANPKRWEYIHSMSPERMARTIVLQDVQKQERTERIRSSVLKKLEENPELKKAYQTLVKNLPEDQQEKMMATLAMRTQRTVTRGQNQEAARPAQRV